MSYNTMLCVNVSSVYAIYMYVRTQVTQVYYSVTSVNAVRFTDTSVYAECEHVRVYAAFYQAFNVLQSKQCVYGVEMSSVCTCRVLQCS